MSISSQGGLRLASLDGGGIHSGSQLTIMESIMYQLKQMSPTTRSEHLRPCDHFDMIGGSDVGGLFAIMFVKLKMTVAEAIEESAPIFETVYKTGLNPKDRIGRLRRCVESLLISRDLPVNLALEDESQDGECLDFVVTALQMNVFDKVHFRTYVDPSEPPSGITVVDAALATCAYPPEFSSVPFGEGYKRRVYIGAGLGANNPIRRVLQEAKTYFGRQRPIGLLLSLGSGHPGILGLSSETESGLYELMKAMMIDSDNEAAKFGEEMDGTDYYFRFSVVQGLQRNGNHIHDFAGISALTESYLRLKDTKQQTSRCVQKIFTKGVMNAPENLGYAPVSALVPAELRTSMTTTNLTMADSPFQDLKDRKATEGSSGETNRAREDFHPEEPPTEQSSLHITPLAESLESLAEQARIYRDQGLFDRAELLQSKIVEALVTQLGETDPSTVSAMSDLASLQLRILDQKRARRGEDHIETIHAMYQLAITYYQQRQYSKAEPLLARALDAYISLEGDQSRRVATCAHDLAWTNYYLHRHNEASELATKAARICENLQRHGVRHPCSKQLAELLALLNQASQVEPREPLNEPIKVAAPTSKKRWKSLRAYLT